MVTTHKPEADVVVVGAGLAGLVCAHDLREAGSTVQVLEACDRPGGRVRTRRLPDTGAIVEQGAGWIGPTQTAVVELASTLGLELHDVRRTGRDDITIAGGRSPGIPALIDYAQALVRLEAIIARTPTHRPWATRKGMRRDALTLGAWLDRRTLTRTARSIFAMQCQASFGCEPQEVSLLAVVHHASAAGGLRRLLGETDDGALALSVHGGNAQLADRLADRLDDVLQLQTRVTAIRQAPDDDGGVVVEHDAGRVRAAAAVVACDPVAVGDIEFSPPLPAARRRIAERWSMRSAVKAHVVYSRPWWRDGGASGTAGSDDGAVGYTWDATGADEPHGVMGCFCEPPDDDRSPDEWLLPALAALHGAAAFDALEIDVYDWHMHPAVRGCVSAPPPGLLGADGDALHASHGRVLFAGAELSDTWDGHMDGAVRSGRATAAHARRLLLERPRTTR